MIGAPVKKSVVAQNIYDWCTREESRLLSISRSLVRTLSLLCIFKAYMYALCDVLFHANSSSKNLAFV